MIGEEVTLAEEGYCTLLDALLSGLHPWVHLYTNDPQITFLMVKGIFHEPLYSSYHPQPILKWTPAELINSVATSSADLVYFNKRDAAPDEDIRGYFVTEGQFGRVLWAWRVPGEPFHMRFNGVSLTIGVEFTFPCRFQPEPEFGGEFIGGEMPIAFNTVGQGGEVLGGQMLEGSSLAARGEGGEVLGGQMLEGSSLAVRGEGGEVIGGQMLEGDLLAARGLGGEVIGGQMLEGDLLAARGLGGEVIGGEALTDRNDGAREYGGEVIGSQMHTSPTAAFLSGSQGSGIASATVTKPAGVLAGDYLIAVVAATNTGATAPNTPAGWTSLTTNTFGTGNRYRMLKKLATGSEPANYTFTAGAAATVNVTIAAYRNANDANYDGGLNGNSSTLTMPSAFELTDFVRVVAYFSAAGMLGYSGPAGYTQRVPASPLTTPPIFVDKKILTDGTEASAVATVTNSGNWIAVGFHVH